MTKLKSRVPRAQFFRGFIRKDSATLGKKSEKYREYSVSLSQFFFLSLRREDLETSKNRFVKWGLL